MDAEMMVEVVDVKSEEQNGRRRLSFCSRTAKCGYSVSFESLRWVMLMLMELSLTVNIRLIEAPNADKRDRSFDIVIICGSF